MKWAIILLEPFPTSKPSKSLKEYIKEIRAATLENGNLLDSDVIHCLCDPPEEPTSISDPDVRLSLSLGVGNADYPVLRIFASYPADAKLDRTHSRSQRVKREKGDESQSD